MAGQEYMGYSRKGKNVSQDQLRNKRKMKETCNSKVCEKSALRHCQLFTETQRNEIFEQFWKTNWNEKRTNISNAVIKKKSDRSRVLEETSRRENTFCYYLKYEKCDRLQVCKKMFIATLGVNKWMIHNRIKESIHGMHNQKSKIMQDKSENETIQKSESYIRTSKDKRKLHLDAWVESLPKMPSHYCRARSNRLYLEGPFESKQEVYDLYVKHCAEENVRPLSKSYIFEFLKEKNFFIFHPRKDQYDTCTSFKMKQINEKEYENHKNMKDRAQDEKKNDKMIAEKDINQYLVLTMDLQSVKLCPILKTSALYYFMKLKVHNFTLYNLANHKSVNHWWNETEGELEASIFCSIITDYLTSYLSRHEQEGLNQKPNKIILYSDGCQNRNAIMANALLNFSIQHQVQIEQKFLVKGHTQMECDAVHSVIE